jgi:iron(III) transport system permease protein
MSVQGPEPITPRLADALTGILSLPSVIAAWRQRQRVSPAWTAGVAIIVSVVALPVATVLLLAINPADNIWPHLVSTVLPGSLWRTLLLSAGVAAVTFAVGTAAAWLVTMYRFPGREVLDRLLVLPLAVPTYIIAYCYVELFDYAGPVQTSQACRRHSVPASGVAWLDPDASR